LASGSPASTPEVPNPIPYPSTRREIVAAYRQPLGTLWLRGVARLMEWSTRLGTAELNYSDVTPQLAVGGSFVNGQITQLKKRGVTAVVDCREEAQDDAVALGQAGLEFLHLPAPDRYAMTYEQLHEGVEWVLDRMSRGGRAFLHCEHGVGRGPLMACAVLVAQGHTAPEALRIVRDGRWQAMPNDRQLKALLAFERDWRDKALAARGSTSSP